MNNSSELEKRQKETNMRKAVIQGYRIGDAEDRATYRRLYPQMVDTFDQLDKVNAC